MMNILLAWTRGEHKSEYRVMQLTDVQRKHLLHCALTMFSIGLVELCTNGHIAPEEHVGYRLIEIQENFSFNAVFQDPVNIPIWKAVLGERNYVPEHVRYMAIKLLGQLPEFVPVHWKVENGEYYKYYWAVHIRRYKENDKVFDKWSIHTNTSNNFQAALQLGILKINEMGWSSPCDFEFCNEGTLYRSHLPVLVGRCASEIYAATEQFRIEGKNFIV